MQLFRKGFPERVLCYLGVGGSGVTLLDRQPFEKCKESLGGVSWDAGSDVVKRGLDKCMKERYSHASDS